MCHCYGRDLGPGSQKIAVELSGDIDTVDVSAEESTEDS